MYPRIIADLDRLRENMERMAALCHAHGLTAALVSKCVCADARIPAYRTLRGCPVASRAICCVSPSPPRWMTLCAARR